MILKLETAAGVSEVRLEGVDARRTLHLDERSLELIVGRCDGGRVEFTLDGRRRRAWVAADGDVRRVFLDGRVHVLHLRGEDHDDAADSGADTGPELRTSLPGRVVRILVQEGQAVKAGEPLLILEAMKMETEVVAARDGVVERIRCEEGRILAPGDPLLDLRHDEEPGE